MLILVNIKKVEVRKKYIREWLEVVNGENLGD